MSTPPWRRAQPITRDAILRRRGAELEEFLVGDDVLFVVVVGFGVRTTAMLAPRSPIRCDLDPLSTLAEELRGELRVGVSSAQEYPVLTHA